MAFSKFRMLSIAVNFVRNYAWIRIGAGFHSVSGTEFPIQAGKN
jgi:hypothetical protein